MLVFVLMSFKYRAFFLYCGNHFRTSVFSREIFRISLVVELDLNQSRFQGLNVLLIHPSGKYVTYVAYRASFLCM
jgi:hypothetical protein